MRPEEKFELRISLQKLLAALVLTIVPLSFVGLYLTSQSDKSLEQTVGSHFKTIAESTAFGVSHFIHDRVVQVGQIAATPTIVDTVAAANRAYQHVSDAAITAKVERIDKTWNTPENLTVKNLLASPASRFLRRHLDLDRRILRITVTDGKGAVVAATHKTLDYYQADEEYWQNIYAQGRGAISLTDILYDDVTKSNYIGVGVPVMEEASSQFIGTVDALVDVSTIFPLINTIQFGPTARTMLVKDDGTVISAPNIELSMKLKSEEYEAVRDALGSLQGRQTGYLAAGMRSGRRLLIGFADTGLKQDYRNLGWVVIVSQEAREASAPLRAIGNFAYLMVVLGLLMVTLVAVYFFSHRKQQSGDIDVLHPDYR